MNFLAGISVSMTNEDEQQLFRFLIVIEKKQLYKIYKKKTFGLDRQ